PTYADGTQADESEAFWTVHLWHASFHPECFLPSDYNDGDRCDVSFDGRTYSGGHAVAQNKGQCGAVRGEHTNDVKVLVTVIAVRNSQPTSARPTTWGQVKATYR